MASQSNSTASSPDTLSGPFPSLDDTFGAMLIGGFISIVYDTNPLERVQRADSLFRFYGICVFQAYTYARSRRSDPIHMYLLVSPFSNSVG